MVPAGESKHVWRGSALGEGTQVVLGAKHQVRGPLPPSAPLVPPEGQRRPGQRGKHPEEQRLVQQEEPGRGAAQAVKVEHRLAGLVGHVAGARELRGAAGAAQGVGGGGGGGAGGCRGSLGCTWARGSRLQPASWACWRGCPPG